MEENTIKGISEIVSNLKKQHVEEINLLNHQHKEVILKLFKQSQTEQQNHAQALKEAREQVKYARWGRCLSCLDCNNRFQCVTTCFSNNSTNKKDTMVLAQGTFSIRQTYESQNNLVQQEISE